MPFFIVCALKSPEGRRNITITSTTTTLRTSETRCKGMVYHLYTHRRSKQAHTKQPSKGFSTGLLSTRQPEPGSHPRDIHTYTCRYLVDHLVSSQKSKASIERERRQGFDVEQVDEQQEGLQLHDQASRQRTSICTMYYIYIRRFRRLYDHGRSSIRKG